MGELQEMSRHNLAREEFVRHLNAVLDPRDDVLE
jgi:hypothetical protein